MSKIKLICVVAALAIFGLNQAQAQADLATESAEQNLTANARTARMLKYPRNPTFTLRRRQPIQIRSRADHFPLRTQIRRVQNGVLPQNQPLRYGYESLKSSKYMPSKGSSLPYSNSVKGTSLRQQLLGVHPNGVHLPALSQQYVQNFKASPAFNGKIVIHPTTGNQQQQQQAQQQQVQQQQQQQSQPQDNSYPKYVKPQQQHQQQLGQQPTQKHPQQLSQQQQQPDLQYPEFKQFPIPDQQQMQKYNEQHEKYLQQQKYLTPRDPMAYYQQQYQQQQQQQQLQQQQQPTYAVHQPSYIAAQKPVLHNTQPSIPIHEVSESSAASSSSAAASAAGAAQQSAYAHGVAPTPPKMYSVYEENDMTELQNNDYQTAQYDSLEKEAQEYLRFMNTNEYFLPKRDPNYKALDEESDRRQQYNLKVQPPQYLQQQQPQSVAASYGQQQQPSYQHNYQALAYQPQSPTSIEEQQQLQHTHYGQPHHHHHGDTSAAASSPSASAYNQPIQVSKLFYQDESGHQGEPSTVVRTSYQTAYNANQFVVSSQDNKASKYLISPQSGIVGSTQSPVSVNNIYSQVRQSPQSSRTPEPLRFEFTERDAMVGGISYTNAPNTPLRYKAVDTPITPKLAALENSTPATTGSVLSTTLRSKTYQTIGGVKPVVEVEDDPEDGDDMQPAGSNQFGRQPLQNKNKAASKRSSSSTTPAPPNEQKDTEDYCERICAIVEDEHEEIVCGSDGYMYTSEAQMECYASCLHIDITIQGKGSCSAR